GATTLSPSPNPDPTLLKFSRACVLIFAPYFLPVQWSGTKEPDVTYPQAAHSNPPDHRIRHIRIGAIGNSASRSGCLRRQIDEDLRRPGHGGRDRERRQDSRCKGLWRPETWRPHPYR